MRVCYLLRSVQLVELSDWFVAPVSFACPRRLHKVSESRTISYHTFVSAITPPTCLQSAPRRNRPLCLPMRRTSSAYISFHFVASDAPLNYSSLSTAEDSLRFAAASKPASAKLLYIVGAPLTEHNAAGLLVWHYLLTFEKEIAFFWKRNFSGACVLFLMNRYLIFLVGIYGLPWWKLRPSELVSWVTILCRCSLLTPICSSRSRECTNLEATYMRPADRHHIMAAAAIEHAIRCTSRSCSSNTCSILSGQVSDDADYSAYMRRRTLTAGS